MGIVGSLKNKLDIYRLEQRYTKRRDRRTAFVSGAQYVDGEYVYDTSEDDSYASPRLAGLHEAGLPATNTIPTHNAQARLNANSAGRKYVNSTYTQQARLSRSASSPVVATDNSGPQARTPTFGAMPLDTSVGSSSPASSNTLPSPMILRSYTHFTPDASPVNPFPTVKTSNRQLQSQSSDASSSERFPGATRDDSDEYWGRLPERTPRKRGIIARNTSWMG